MKYFSYKLAYWYWFFTGKIHGDKPPPEPYELTKKKIEILQKQDKPITKDSTKRAKA